MIDLGVYLNILDQIHSYPAAWFEKKIAAKGLKSVEENKEV